MPKKKLKSSDRWFIKVRGSYLPNSWQGWLTYVPYAAYVIGVLLFALDNTSDWLHAVPLIVPNWLVALIAMTWVAEHKS